MTGPSPRPARGARSGGDAVELCTTVHYGQTFTVPCSNGHWREDPPGYDDCTGTLTFGPDDREAACGTCGARGRLVAFGLPTGARRSWRCGTCRRTYPDGRPTVRGDRYAGCPDCGDCL